MKLHFLKSCAAGLALVAGSLGAASAAEPLKMGYSNWADVLATVHVAKVVLETKLDQPVNLVSADIGIQFQGVARGDLDVMLGAWLPMTHGAYYEKNKSKLDDIGVVYTGGKNGWAVPAYVPVAEVASVADLAKPEVKAKMGGTVYGVEPGGGLMIASEKTIKEYGLDAAGYKLQASSEAGMLSALSRAYPSKQWVVTTVWSPHWLFQKWDMRYLKDPKGTLGGEEQIHALGSKQFATKLPKAYAFVKSFKLDLQDIEAIQNDAQKDNDYPAAAKRFVAAHPEKVAAWLPH